MTPHEHALGPSAVLTRKRSRFSQNRAVVVTRVGPDAFRRESAFGAVFNWRVSPRVANPRGGGLTDFRETGLQGLAIRHDSVGASLFPRNGAG